MGIKIGARYVGGGSCEFVVCASQAREVVVSLISPGVGMIPMDRAAWRHVFCVMNFDSLEATFSASPPLGRWKKLLDSASEE